jgi:hypothetical protein
MKQCRCNLKNIHSRSRQHFTGPEVEICKKYFGSQPAWNSGPCCCSFRLVLYKYSFRNKTPIRILLYVLGRISVFWNTDVRNLVPIDTKVESHASKPPHLLSPTPDAVVCAVTLRLLCLQELLTTLSQLFLDLSLAKKLCSCDVTDYSIEQDVFKFILSDSREFK